ncbi:pyrroline-5-carboxylate reductase [Desulfatitalea alkaliphila]|uniref:Pyrroline-5-carboxylate reductase n=1 Tax=Desulfatitalea alkaliphila TaxID=2929485 RepID=A0AA41R453_9BACT|nr:pyrroline-5-carboxylate reductase [Desulfatitalea alkaliphila]MCJ8500441.1 pyrroline-5-carboxylate reductase [Desulfatitalea alkaliphila]
MLEGKIIGFVGSGNMAEALISGLLATGRTHPENILCADINAERRNEMAQRYGVVPEGDNTALIARADVVIYAVKPQIMDSVLRQTAAGLRPTQLVISIAAGIPMAAIAVHTAQPLHLVRAMPNVCAAVKAAATAIVAGPHATTADRQTASTIFASVGECVTVPAEHLLDAVTGLSGSGPAYVFLILEALADAGVKMGLARAEALRLAAQTVAGAARMQLETNVHPAVLKDRVTSPGGTTIAGLHALEKGGLRAILMDAVEMATQRAQALGVTPSPTKD